MSEAREKDHWRELAELLGLPPEETKPAGHPQTAREERRDEVRLDEAREYPPGRQEWEPAPAVADAEEPEPVAEDAFEPVVSEEAIQGDVSEADSMARPEFSDESFERELAEPVSIEPEAEREPDDDSSRERPRRGRRRGRRGNRGDSRERDERTRNERAPRTGETHRDNEDAAGESAGAVPGREPADEESRRFQGEPEQSSEDADEEVFETERAAGPAAFAEDDDEVDKLTDWNVPSWAELISSLYRPER